MVTVIGVLGSTVLSALFGWGWFMDWWHGGPNADNLSIVAVRWEDSYVDATSGLSSVISTQKMAPETVTTRLDAFGRNPKYKTELSEDEIERAIEEIRSTIQKFSK